MVSASGTPVDLELVAGLPYARRFRVTGAASIWPTVESFEIRSHIREGRNENTPLVGRLDLFLTSTIEGQDVVVDLTLTGEQTRSIVKGFYDIIISDPGTEDARALSISSGKVKVSYLRTAATDE